MTNSQQNDFENDWSVVRREKVKRLIKTLYEVVHELESEFKNRKFTPDGHLVGSLGEVVAAYAFGLKLLPQSNKTHDAITSNGKFVQIKLTGGSSGVDISSIPDYLIVIQMRNNKFQTVYNGTGTIVWPHCGRMQKNGQRSIGLVKLRQLNEEVKIKIEQIRSYPNL